MALLGYHQTGWRSRVFQFKKKIIIFLLPTNSTFCWFVFTRVNEVLLKFQQVNFLIYESCAWPMYHRSMVSCICLFYIPNLTFNSYFNELCLYLSDYTCPPHATQAGTAVTSLPSTEAEGDRYVVGSGLLSSSDICWRLWVSPLKQVM